MKQPSRKLRAVTLAELIVSMVVMTLLLGGMTSAILLASNALPNSNHPLAQSALGLQAVEMLAADLESAVTVIRTTSSEIEFTVPDRGHGSTGPETLRYRWQGAGQPLTRQYNGGTEQTLASGVTSCVFESVISMREPDRPPTVLMIVADAVSPLATETLKRSELEGWGFTVSLLSSDATQAAFDAAVANADVVFVGLHASSMTLGTKIRAAPIGVVVEGDAQMSSVGVATGTSVVSESSLVANGFVSHPITAGFSTLSATAICTSVQPLLSTSGLCSSAKVLAYRPLSVSPILVVVDYGGALLTSGTAPARRVLLPWGGNAFDSTAISTEGWSILRRSLVWASARRVVSRVSINLQIGASASNTVCSEVQMLNLPEAP